MDSEDGSRKVSSIIEKAPRRQKKAKKKKGSKKSRKSRRQEYEVEVPNQHELRARAGSNEMNDAVNISDVRSFGSRENSVDSVQLWDKAHDDDIQTSSQQLGTEGGTETIQITPATAHASSPPQISASELFWKPTFDESAVLILQQDALLASRVQRPRASSARGGKANAKTGIAKEPLTIDAAWRQYLLTLARESPDFFSSEEASLRVTTAAVAGKAAYAGLRINHTNNADLMEIWKVEYEPKITGGGSDGTFRQLCLVAGQLMRLSIVRDVTKANDAHEPGQLFEAICNCKTIDLLIDHFRARAICTTVMTKAMHLKKIAEHAFLFFTGKDEILCGRSERSRVHLRTIFNVQKALGRARAAEKRNLDSRIANVSVFMPQDFANCKSRVKLQLDGVMESFAQKREDKGKEFAEKWLFEKSVTQKWCINFLVLLVVVGGGQRPQVYAQMQVPKRVELQEMRDTARRGGFFELRTVKEKTSRSRNMPYVLLPSSALRYLEFHVEYVRRGIMESLDYEELECSTFPILLDTRTGQELSTAQITRTFQSFLQTYEPELAGVTVMNLRSSYGTMLMRAYREKRVFVGLSEDEFLNQLSYQMNTSPEQLRATYIGIDRTEHETSARKLMQALAETIGEDDHERAEEKGNLDSNIEKFLM